MDTTKETDALYPRARYGDRDLEFFESHGYRKPVGPAVDGLWSYVSFSWIAPLIQKGKLRELNEGSATPFVPYRNDSAVLARQFDSMYAKLEERQQRAGSRRGNLLFKTLLSLHWRAMVCQLFWVAEEVAVRLSAPVLLRELLTWLRAPDKSDVGGPNKGWLWAILFGTTGFLLTLGHHQLFWYGMRLGFDMRQQAMAAVQAKVLRLNSTAISDVTNGKIVNLVSNDVRRFDDAGPMWAFLFLAPLELACVVLMISLELGPGPAFAGVGALLAIIPIQGLLSRHIGKLRDKTATQTDERVRLEGEAISGALAMKMLGWEDWLSDAIGRVRASEAACCARMNRVRAANMALQFAIVPVSAFVTFSVVWAKNEPLQISSVFYTLALLNLPQLFMATFFTRGVETTSELRISLRRLDAFLALPEPPPPSHQDTGRSMPGGTVQMRGACFDWNDRSWAAASGQAPLAAAAVLAPNTALSTVAITAHGSPSTIQPYSPSTIQLASAHIQNANQKANRKANPEAPFQNGSAADSPIVHASQLNGSQGAATSDLSMAPPSTAVGTFQLDNVKFALRPGELLGICGEVGSGKSTVLAALLGELQPMASTTALPSDIESGGSTAALGPLVAGRVAFCSQVPWVVAGTVQENVTFGLAFDPAKYQAVIDACALTDDIEVLPAGSATELGERGINLSGGQKARLALARAAYAEPQVALLDDPLSAVDPRVGRVLFDDCIGPRGLLSRATRVLVTHQRHFLPACDRLLVLRDGRVIADGHFDQLQQLGLPELHLPAEAELDDDAYDATHRRLSIDDCLPAHPGAETMANSTGMSKRQPSTVSEAGNQSDNLSDRQTKTPSLRAVAPHNPGESFPGNSQDETDDKGENGGDDNTGIVPSGSGLRRRRIQIGKRGPTFSLPYFGRRRAAQDGAVTARGDIAAGDDATEDPISADARAEKLAEAGKLITSEGSATGSLGWQVWVEFGKYLGVVNTLLLAALMIGGQGVFVAASYWLAIWSSRSFQDQQRAKYLYTYGILTGCVLLVALVRSFLFFGASLRAGTKMHNAMAFRVLHAPLSFFHTNPTGRMLNRFSKDQGIVDEFLPQVLFDALQSSFSVLGALVLVAIAVPYIIPVFLPLLAIFWWIRGRYVITSREVKRFEAASRSPVFASFSAALKGLPTIRAYGAEDRFRADFLAELDANGSWWYAFISTARWVGFRLDVVAAVTLLLAAIFAMALRDKLSTRLVGLALSYTLTLSAQLQWATRQTAEAENDMTSVERVLQFTHLPQEPARVKDGAAAPPQGWPGSGSITFEAVTARYRPGLPSVLSDISFNVPGGSSCGVVGRTGSGKSSLMLCLFRLIDVTAGRILIDGLDASSIGIDALRSQLCIIPQDPVLFSGTLRSNLDPGRNHSEARIASALQAAQLTSAVAAAGGLDARMAEAGDNLSVGQRQLFCLARALLQGAKVLALDEATANVDRTTDQLIQKALRAAVGGQGPDGLRRTLLVIAHRVDTILDCDGLLVLDHGRLVESGAPQELSTRPGGTFARLVSAAAAPRTAAA